MTSFLFYTFKHTFVSFFWAEWGTIIWLSSSVVKTFPLLPKVNTVDRFFRDGFAENILMKKLSIKHNIKINFLYGLFKQIYFFMNINGLGKSFLLNRMLVFTNSFVESLCNYYYYYESLDLIM